MGRCREKTLEVKMKSCKSNAFGFLLTNKASCRSETSKHIKALCFVVNAAKAVCILAAFTGLLCDSFYPRSVCFLPLIIFLSAFKHWQCANTAQNNTNVREPRLSNTTGAAAKAHQRANKEDACKPGKHMYIGLSEDWLIWHPTNPSRQWPKLVRLKFLGQPFKDRTL